MRLSKKKQITSTPYYVRVITYYTSKIIALSFFFNQNVTLAEFDILSLRFKEYVTAKFFEVVLELGVEQMA